MEVKHVRMVVYEVSHPGGVRRRGQRFKGTEAGSDRVGGYSLSDGRYLARPRNGHEWDEMRANLEEGRRKVGVRGVKAFFIFAAIHSCAGGTNVEDVVVVEAVVSDVCVCVCVCAAAIREVGRGAIKLGSMIENFRDVVMKYKVITLGDIFLLFFEI